MTPAILQQYLMENQWILWLVIAWVLPWKGVALWKAAKRSHKWWFIAILILNTLAILPIVYIFVFSKRGKPSTKLSGVGGRNKRVPWPVLRAEGTCFLREGLKSNYHGC